LGKDHYLCGVAGKLAALCTILLKVDGLTMGQWEGGVLGLTGVATGIVLSGGQMRIAHKLPTMPNGGWKVGIAIVWLLMLLFSVVMIAPLLVVGISHQADLSEALATPFWRWAWSIVAVASVELIAAGVMVADAIAPEGAVGKRESTEAEPDIEISKPEPPQLPDEGGQTTIPLTLTKAKRQQAILEYYTTHPASSQRVAEAALSIPKATIGNDLRDLESRQAIRRANGLVTVLVSPDQWAERG
jgi:hypothetical protein